MVFYILVFLGLLFFLIKWLSISSQNDIVEDLKQYFKAHKNIDGDIEIQLNNRRIKVTYKTEHTPKSIAEYVIAYIDFSEFSIEKLEKCKLNISYIQEDHRNYAIVHSSWGYKGEKFRQRITQKITEIENCLNLKEK